MTQLTENDWARLAPLLKNIDPNRQRAAYNRLVLGMTYAAAGEAFGYSRQDVNYVVRAVLRWWDRLAEVPDKSPVPRGCVRLEFDVPRRKAAEVRRLVESALQAQPAAKAVSKGVPKGAKPVASRAKVTSKR